MGRKGGWFTGISHPRNYEVIIASTATIYNTITKYSITIGLMYSMSLNKYVQNFVKTTTP